ncbi:hypothetical protein B6D12_10435 [Gilliamella apicola]|uniref:DUF6694 family lipoprotein n=1 Tax=Gilliamella TaxID=1193503 RepID=UPI000810CC5A|nr:DUF6694 family lipoprotein [Gilliamella apicola]OCF93737.1 hypothetical protein A9G17_11750 [Gilliamella apicola]OTP88086.1 hypothetical protein B5S41_10565 [Gilliamella apicola]OTP92976.1 hypothetical protein B6D13_11205 [Gilliamella apicola]OTP95579.1 hypothetical protein B6D05_06145 [Gilliamella apicola]OTQ02282.1 hypothetical protein B6D07_06155 [Gilliamella apicola]
MKKLLIVVISTGLLIGCSDKTIDASSSENLQKSISEMVNELQDDQLQSFNISIGRIMINSAIEAAGDEKKKQEIIKNKINGKTVSEVIEIGANEKLPGEAG